MAAYGDAAAALSFGLGGMNIMSSDDAMSAGPPERANLHVMPVSVPLGGGLAPVVAYELRGHAFDGEASAERFRTASAVATVVWPSAIATARELAARAAALPHCRVLELGCGPGLCALTAYRLGATVLATDASPAALQLVREGGFAAKRSGAPPPTAALEARVLDVFDEAAVAAVIAEFRPDLVVASDLLFDGEIARAVARVVLHACRGPDSAMALVADPGRESRAEFLAELAEERAFRCARFEPRAVVLDGVVDGRGVARHAAGATARVDLLTLG